MSNKSYSEAQIASYWNMRFKEAMVTKAPYTKRWTEYYDAYFGEYFKNKNLPEYKSNLVSNYIFSIIETIRPIMLDNNPKFQAVPRQPEGLYHSSDVQEAMTYEWDREDMNLKLYRELIPTLVVGNSVFFIPWDADEKQVKGIPVDAFNLFPDPLATSIDDSEYIIYAAYKNEVVLQRLFPSKSDKLIGGSINYSELVNHNDRNAQVDNQILVLEVFTRDYESEEYEVDDNVKKVKPKYPYGRQITICPDLGIVLEDKAIPYKNNRFPFEIIKDYDIPGKFWGEGEVAQLLSPQTYMNEIYNAVIDHAKTTANSPWIIDKSAGIGLGKITSRQGLIIRKNSGSEVRRENPPQMPGYVINTIENLKGDMNEISGIFNTLKGNSESGVYTAQGILALQEAGQARVRLKVKILEESLGKIARAWYSRMQQFWDDDRWLLITKSDGEYDMKKFVSESLNFSYDIRITAGSTMTTNRSAMLDLMIRLAQTQMSDGQTLVDREAVAHYLPEEVKSAMLKRMKGDNVQIQELGKAVEQIGQQLQQFVQENQQNDAQTLQTVEQLVQAVEAIKSEIISIEDKLEMEEKQRLEQEKLDKVKTESYNSGYVDAEKLYTEEVNVENEDGGIPEDLLQGLETLTDEELELVLTQQPELAELINQSGF